MSKRFWIILIAIAVVFGVIFHFTSKKTTTTATNTKPTNHIEGQGQTGVTLVEYGDYQCPYCGEYYPIVKQVVATNMQKIFFQFRNLPLTQLHQNAYSGARAAEAAALQNKFWEMHDALYESQNTWATLSDPETYFVSIAQQLGLDTNKFKQDFSSQKVNDLITADMNAFSQTGKPEATPSFFLDGTLIQPGPSATSFQNFINSEIAKKTMGSPASTPSNQSTTPQNQSVQSTPSTSH